MTPTCSGSGGKPDSRARASSPRGAGRYTSSAGERLGTTTANATASGPLPGERWMIQRHEVPSTAAARMGRRACLAGVDTRRDVRTSRRTVRTGDRPAARGAPPDRIRSHGRRCSTEASRAAGESRPTSGTAGIHPAQVVQRCSSGQPRSATSSGRTRQAGAVAGAGSADSVLTVPRATRARVGLDLESSSRYRQLPPPMASGRLDRESSAGRSALSPPPRGGPHARGRPSLASRRTGSAAGDVRPGRLRPLRDYPQQPGSDALSR